MTTQTISIDQAFDFCFKKITMLEQKAAAQQKLHQESTLKMRKRISSLEAADAMRRAGRSTTEPIEFASQFGEDVIIWGLLGGQLSGFFVEAGAYDGRTLSVSLALEQIGWRGLLVEPIPEFAELCRTRRPNSKVAHAALGGPDAHGETTFTVTQDQWGSLLSFCGEASAFHRAKLESENASERRITVPMNNLANLLEGCTERVDVAVIDVEGSEVAVLKGFDLAKYRPRIMIIEDDLSHEQTEVMKYMRTLPDYLQVGTVLCSRVFVHKDEHDVLARVPTVF